MGPSMGILDKILRAGEGKKVKALAGIVPDINALEPEMKALSDDALQAKTAEFRQRLANGEDLDDLLIEAFAVIREAAQRVIGQRHYDVQLMGGAALHFGWVAEMKTGEGKTLVSTLPAYLNGLTGQGVHIITVNDYLARRDAEWMGQIHRWLGLDVGLVIPGWQDQPQQKRASTRPTSPTARTTSSASTTSATTWPPSLADKVQRGHVYAIVDEVDSILIDEARTPLIISGRVADAAKLYYQFASIARSLRRDEDYEVDEEKRTVAPTEDGIEQVERALGLENLYDEVQQNLVHQLSAALKAKELYKRDKDYIIQDGEVKIVDEFTGRILEGRRWSRGHPPGRRGQGGGEDQGGEPDPRHDHPAELLPHVREARRHDRHGPDRGRRADEHLRAAGGAHPHHRPMVRADQADLIYKTEVAKFDAVVDDLVERAEQGPARARRHDLGREVRVPVQPAAQAGHRPRGAQRQAAHA